MAPFALLLLLYLAGKRRGGPAMTVKPGADVGGLHPAMAYAAGVVARIYAEHFAGAQVVVTSGREGAAGDGIHKAGSLHYPRAGDELRALDFRTRDHDPAARAAFAQDVAAALGWGFDVVNHPTTTDPASMPVHLHVEFDPK